MEVNFLLDTNILVYHVSGDPKATKFVEDAITSGYFRISVLSMIEFLGWHGHSDENFIECKKLTGLATVLPVSTEIADKAIELRRERRIKLADAVIASTALVNGLSLVTRNTRDFRGIYALSVIDPFT